jgi:outer membrane protein
MPNYSGDGAAVPRATFEAFPIAAPAESLQTAWAVALSTDQKLAASSCDVSAAQSGLDAARAERMPSFSAGAEYYALSQAPAVLSTVPPLGTLEVPIANRDAGLGHAMVTQPIFTSGRISSGIDAATDNVAAREADQCRTVLDVKINVAEIFARVLLAGRIVEVAESKVVSLTSHDNDVSVLFEKGAVSKNDLLASQVALADAQQKALDARADLEVARAAYNRALGRDLAQPVWLADIQDRDAVPPIEELTQLALSQRPELTALSAQARALQDEAASLRGKNGPQVVVTGGYLYFQDDYLRPNGYTGAVVGVEWNPLDCGRVKSQARVLDEKSQSLIRLRRDAESIISLEVRQKWIDLQTARKRVLVAQKTIAQADENLRVARDRYQHQAGTNTEVLDAETLRVQAYMNLYSSTYQAALAGLRLRRAVGNL